MQMLINRRCVHMIRRLYNQNAQSSALSLPTDFFQKSLPILPFPDFKETISGYLDQQEGILEPKDFLKLQKLTNEFYQNDGKSLNEELYNAYQKNKEVFGGLQYMNSLLAWNNPLLKQTYGNLHFEDYTNDSQLEIASKLLHAIGIVQKSLRDNTFRPMLVNTTPSLEKILLQTPEQYRTKVAQSLGIIPFNMEPFSKAFSTSRIPAAQRDTFRFGKNSKNVIVIRNGHMFSIDLLKDDGVVTSVEDLLAQLEDIYQQSQKPSETQVAVLTSLQRHVWAEYRDQLLTDYHNVDLLRKVEESITVLSLDGKYTKTSRGRNILFGGDPGNRWFDRSLSVAVDEEGSYVGWSANVTETHVSVVAHIVENVKDVYKKLTVKQRSSICPHVEVLSFQVDDKVQQGIQTAKTEFNDMQKTYKCVHFELDKVNLKEFQRQNIHPESVINIVNQVTFIKLYGGPQNFAIPIFIPTYSNSHYCVIYPTWKSTINVAKGFVSKGTMDIDSLRLNSEKYESLLAQTTLGVLAVEPHLRALEEFAAITGKGLHFFESDDYQKSLALAMDFSLIPYIPARNLTYTGFDGGLGFGYKLDSEMFTGCITSSQDKQPALKEFMMTFMETLENFHQSIANN